MPQRNVIIRKNTFIIGAAVEGLFIHQPDKFFIPPGKSIYSAHSCSFFICDASYFLPCISSIKILKCHNTCFLLSVATDVNSNFPVEYQHLNLYYTESFQTYKSRKIYNCPTIFGTVMRSPKPLQCYDESGNLSKV